MTATAPPPSTHRADRAKALALRLTDAEGRLHALAAGQIDAIVDREGRTYLLRPAQEDLRQNERRLQAVLEGIADVITVVDRGGKILLQSRAASRVLGYTSEELVGSWFFELIHADDLPRLYAAYFDVIEGFHDNATEEFRHRARDGTYRLLEAAIGRIHGPSSAARVVLSLRDRTASRQEPPRAAEANL